MSLPGLSACLLAGFAQPLHAATYICQIDGKAVFTTEKQGRHCQLSSMNGISDAPTDSASAPAGNDNISRIWEKEQFGSYDDIKILPTVRNNSVTNTAEAAAPPMNVRLRNQPRKNNAKSKAAPRTAAPVIAPPPKPQLTRRQILQNEVRNEQSALVRAQAQLNVARKKGDKAKITRLEQAVRDREANIRAIKSEMGR
ncbi:hypothetical protein LVJ83_00435 [Uruburuella testudinis]|uniref:DUF4124 domain-containing protein n=1 Tax=Uruburuella testudinis TaxID=1282863 RepID=A0ABY4DZ52_9NEIS|nr:hypothetical protein [Uruburuella testudinis]UOO81981.1 hypothetical protein LVJ83_00435 [Uruburuella testudinis]